MSAHFITPLEPFEIRNDSKDNRDVVYASLTACDQCVVKFWLHRGDISHLFELVYIGGGASHSWWTASGGKFFPPEFPHGLEPGDVLTVESTGQCAFRIDWYQ